MTLNNMIVKLSYPISQIQAFTPRVLHISAAVETLESPSILETPVVQQYNVKSKKIKELIRVRMSE